MNRLEMARILVEKARRLGAADAEAFVMNSSSAEIQIRDGQADTVTYRDSSGYGLRLLLDNKLGFVSSNNLEMSEADALIKKAIVNTRLHTADEHNVLPDPVAGDKSAKSPEQFDATLTTIPVEKKIAKVIAVDAAARNADRRIAQIAWLQYGDSSREFAIASSRGIEGESRHSEAYAFALAVAMIPSPSGQPDPATAQTGIAVDVCARFDDLDPNRLGRKAAEYALRMLGAEDGRTGELDGVFPPETGFNFIKLIADMARADLVQKKKSLFAGRLGEMVASDKVTIIDDGRLPGGLASRLVDGEGVPTTTKEIIKEGRLTQLLYDSYTAHRAGTVSTGNADRSEFDNPPVIAPTNFYLEPGKLSRENLIASVSDGLYVTEVSGLHASVNLVTGDFSIPGKGLRIRHGELTTPVSNITISGNVFHFFKNVDAVASDLTWEYQDDLIGTPTFKISGIKIGGK